MQGISWKRAYAYSAVTHLAVIGIATLLLGSVALHQEQELYVVNLDISDTSGQGSGHAGGGGGSGALFPDKLSESEVQQKVEQATESTTQQEPTPAAVPDPSSNAIPTETTTTPVSSGTPAASGGTSSGGNAAGAGSGSGSGGGYGTGVGTGSGDGAGDGQGYGEGSGSGQGSGNSGVEGTGSQPFDADGLWSAINSNKQYPLMALKRNITGSVTIQTILDVGGNITSVSVVSSSGNNSLDQAAVNAAYAVGSYPNPTGQTVTANTTVTFALN